MADKRPILLFDSGVGGLSVLGHVRKILPAASIVYAADNGGYPYGTKSEAEIASRVPALLGRLVERFTPRIAVIACNTASTIALTHIRAALDLPVVGTVPAIKPAALASKTRVIGVLGTDATVRQPYVDRLSAEFASDCRVIRHSSAELVEIAEAKLRGTPPDPAAMARIMDGLFAQPDGDRIDQLILSCTHFPLLAEEIAAASPAGIALVDSGEGSRGGRLSSLKDRNGLEAANGVAVFTRDDPDLAPLGPALRGYGLTQTSILKEPPMPLDNQQLLDRFNARMPPTAILFGMTVLEVDQQAGRVRMSFAMDERFCNPRGTVQGGIVGALLDDAAAFAGIVALGEPGFIASMEIKTSFLAAALPGTLYAEGRCLKMGRSSCFLEADLTDGDGKLLAKLSSSAIPIRSDQKPKLVASGR